VKSGTGQQGGSPSPPTGGGTQPAGPGRVAPPEPRPPAPGNQTPGQVNGSTELPAPLSRFSSPGLNQTVAPTPSNYGETSLPRAGLTPQKRDSSIQNASYNAASASGKQTDLEAALPGVTPAFVAPQNTLPAASTLPQTTGSFSRVSFQEPVNR